jgi:glycosyltransferase involved in cell wall biosynthesis
MQREIYLYLKYFPGTGYPIVGGSCKAVHGLAKGFAACGVKVTVLCEGGGKEHVESYAGYEIHSFPATYSISKFSVSPNLRRFLSEQLANSALVILNGNFTPSLFSISNLLRKRDIDYLIAPHGTYHPNIFKRNPHLKWPYWYLFEKTMLNRASAVQILDNRQEIHLRRLGVGTSVICAPNGYIEDELIDATKLVWRESPGIRAIFFGRIDVYNKGLDLLLSAVAVCITRGLDIKLTIQGEDARCGLALLKAKVRDLGLEDTVFFCPPNYVHRPAEILQDYDVLCLPSRFEGFGLSALDAMLAARVLLVSEDAGISPHVIASGCGELIRPEISSIAEGFFRLNKRRATWRAMGTSGREYALSKLSWKNIASGLLLKYEKMT